MKFCLPRLIRCGCATPPACRPLPTPAAAYCCRALLLLPSLLTNPLGPCVASGGKEACRAKPWTAGVQSRPAAAAAPLPSPLLLPDAPNPGADRRRPPSADTPRRAPGAADISVVRGRRGPGVLYPLLDPAALPPALYLCPAEPGEGSGASKSGGGPGCGADPTRRGLYCGAKKPSAPSSSSSATTQGSRDSSKSSLLVPRPDPAALPPTAPPPALLRLLAALPPPADDASRNTPLEAMRFSIALKLCPSSCGLGRPRWCHSSPANTHTMYTT